MQNVTRLLIWNSCRAIFRAEHGMKHKRLSRLCSSRILSSSAAKPNVTLRSGDIQRVLDLGNVVLVPFCVESQILPAGANAQVLIAVRHRCCFVNDVVLLLLCLVMLRSTLTYATAVHSMEYEFGG